MNSLTSGVDRHARLRTSAVLQVLFVKNTMYFVSMVMKVLSEDAEFYAYHGSMWFLWVC